MGIFRPFESKRRIRDVLARGYWFVPGDMIEMTMGDPEWLQRFYNSFCVQYMWRDERKPKHPSKSADKRSVDRT